MVSKTNEQALESAIEKFLTGSCLERSNKVSDKVALWYKLEQALIIDDKNMEDAYMEANPA